MPDLRLLDGKVALITGAASGQGRAASVLFAEHGARIAVADVNDDGARETVDLVEQAGSKAVAMHADVSRRADNDAMVAAAVDAFGGIDVLYNNAAIQMSGRLVECTEEQWDITMATNLNAIFWACRAAMPRVRRGQSRARRADSADCYRVRTEGARQRDRARLNRHTPVPEGRSRDGRRRWLRQRAAREHPAAVAADVTSEEDVRRMVGAATGGNGDGRLDVLVCSAAVEVRASLADTSDDEWQRVLDVNVKGPFLCLKHAIPPMTRSGGGSAILLGSVLGAIGSPGYAAYCASKGALVNLAKQAAIEHAPDKVRVNVVSPTACEAGLFLKVVEQAPDPEAIKQMVAERTPMRRLGTADDVCESIMFLAGDESSYISGAVFPLDGGLAARRM